MGTEIIKSFGVLQFELEQAKNSLKGVDENIKRLIGRDPSEIVPRQIIKRGLPNEENNRNRQRVLTSNRNRNFSHENDEPAGKRRNMSVFKRLSERPVHYEEETAVSPQKQLISKVIVTPREIPSRQEALAAQHTDEKSKARNKRMFGALLGTLQKFQQEETKLKSKELKRAQVEKKIEEHEIREKAEIKKERQELFFSRKKKQAEIKMIELKMTRMKEYAAWEERQKPRTNFIMTKTRPQLYYLPRKLNDANKALLENCKLDVEQLIEKRRQDIFIELQHIEERMKKNFESKRPKEVVQAVAEQCEKDETKMEYVEHENPVTYIKENCNISESEQTDCGDVLNNTIIFTSNDCIANNNMETEDPVGRSVVHEDSNNMMNTEELTVIDNSKIASNKHQFIEEKNAIEECAYNNKQHSAKEMNE